MSLKKSAAQLLEKLEKQQSAIILLHGEMGAGKTTLVAEVMKNLVPNSRPSSPTFNIINQYSDTIFHADLYRIKSEAELENIGFFELLKDGIMFIEWPERTSVDYSFYNNVIDVTIEVQSDGKRKIFIN